MRAPAVNSLNTQHKGPAAPPPAVCRSRSVHCRAAAGGHGAGSLVNGLHTHHHSPFVGNEPGPHALFDADQQYARSQRGPLTGGSSVGRSSGLSPRRVPLPPRFAARQASSEAAGSSGNGQPGTSLVAGAVSSLRRLMLNNQDESETVQVKFCLKYRTQFGQSVKLIGSHPKLGSWDLNKALELKWSEGDRWIANVELPAGSVYEYKYVLLDHESRQALAWQQGGNAVLALGDQDQQGVEVQDNWGNVPGGAAVIANGQSLTREAKLQTWVNEFQRYKQEAKTAQIELSRKQEEVQAAKAQVARLKMELSLASKARDDLELKVTELEAQNMSLRAEVANSNLAMKSTLEEAIRLLQNEVEGEDETDGYAEDDAGSGTDSTGASSSGSWGWGFSNGSSAGSGSHSAADKDFVFAHNNNGSSSSNGSGAAAGTGSDAGNNGVGRTFERFGIRLGLGGSAGGLDDAGAAASMAGNGAGHSHHANGNGNGSGSSSNWGFRFSNDDSAAYSAQHSGTANGNGVPLADWRSRLNS